MSGGEAPNHCNHFVMRKKRYCRIGVNPGEIYCGEHQPISKNTEGPTTSDGKIRITCPLDAKHTCYAHNLQKHLKICNARETTLPPYIVKNFNNKDGSNEPNRPLSSYSVEEIAKVIHKVEKIFEDRVRDKVSEKISQHPVVEEELAKPEYGDKTKKHLKQASAILGLLSDYHLIRADTCYIEFGAGRGLLSYWLAKATENTNPTFLLVERASPKHKRDNKLDKSEDKVKRIRADIADLVLDKVEAVEKINHIVGITKHLCGDGTDLALRCLGNTDKFKDKVSGSIMTFCCHHRCRWSSYTGRDFFQAVDLSRDDFAMMCGMSSWATCGTGFSREKNNSLNEEFIETELNNRDKELGLNREQKEELGKKCKNLLNFGRVQYLEQFGFKCKLHNYVSSDVSLENVCIVAYKDELKDV